MTAQGTHWGVPIVARANHFQISERARARLEWAIPLVLYAAVCIPIYEHHRDLLSGDGVSYLRRAGYLAGGDVWNAISGYWSPLIVVLVSPFVRMGLDCVHMAHVINAVLAAGSILILGLLLRRFTSAGPVTRCAAMCIGALFAAVWGLRFIAPDGLMAELLLATLLIVVRRDFVARPRWQLIGGVLGGLAYLAKAYALPVFLVAMPLVLVLLARPGPGWRRIVRAMVVLLMGFAMMAGPWIGVLSHKYGHFTFSLAASRAHAVMGPTMNGRYYPEWGPVRDPFIAHWENPEELRYDFWSPLASWGMFRHQMVVVWGNLSKLGEFALEWSMGGIALIMLAGALVAALTGFGLSPARRREMAALLVVSGVYASGLLPGFLLQRYVIHMGVPLLMIVALMLVSEWRRSGDRPAGIARTVVTTIILLSFAGGGVVQVNAMLSSRADERELRRAGEEAKRLGLSGPLACEDHAHGNGIAFFGGVKNLGFPPVEDVAAAERMLEREHVRMIAIYHAGGQSGVSRRVVEDGGWRLAVHRGRVEIYVRAVGRS